MKIFSSAWNGVKNFISTRHGKIITCAAAVVVVSTGVILTLALTNKQVKVTAKADDLSSDTAYETSSANSIDSSSAVVSSAPAVSSAAPAPVPAAVPAAQSVNISSGAITLTVGQSKQLTGAVSPANANQTVTWSSSDKYIASVSAQGVVTAKDSGTVYIHATDTAGHSATCVVKITGSASGTGAGTEYKGTAKNYSGGNTGSAGGTGGGSTNTGGGTGNSGTGGTGTAGGTGGNNTPTGGQNLAGLTDYGNYPYQDGVSATNAQFRQNSGFSVDQIATDVMADFTQQGKTFKTSGGDVYEAGNGLSYIRGLLDGKVADVWFTSSAKGFDVDDYAII